MSTKQEWRDRSHKLGGGRYGIECGVLKPSGVYPPLYVNFGDFQVNLNGDPGLRKAFGLTSEFLYAATRTHTTCNQYINAGGLIPEGLVTETLVPNITGVPLEDLSLFPIIAVDANTPPRPNSHADAYVRVSDPRDNLHSTPQLEKAFKDEFPFNPEEDDYQEFAVGYDAWLVDQLQVDDIDVDVQTLVGLLEEQYGLVVPMKDVLARISYLICKTEGQALERYWPYIDGTKYEDEYIKLLTGANLLDSQQVKRFTSMILGK